MTRVDMDLLPALSWPFGCFQFLFRWMWPFHLVLHCQRTAVGSRLRCLWLSGQVCAAFVMRGRTGRHLGCTQRTDSETLSLVLFWWRAHNATADVRYAEPRVYRPHPSAECGVAGRSGPPAGAFPPGLLQRRVGAVTRTKRSWPQQPKHTAEEGKKEAKTDEEAVLAPHGAGGMLSASSQTPNESVPLPCRLLIVGRVFPFAEQRGGAETERCTRGRHGAAYNSAALRPESTIRW